MRPVEIDVELPADAALWDEFDPVVHSLTTEWLRDGVLQDRRTTTFGIRSFVAEDKRLKLNGRPVFLRGTLDCCIFPLTGYPPTDHDGWRKVFGTVKAYGLNHVRYHSYCPPKAAFEVADEIGVLLHVETPVWPVLGADPNLDRYIYAEAERIVRDYGNHPELRDAVRRQRGAWRTPARVPRAVRRRVEGPGQQANLHRRFGLADYDARRLRQQNRTP